MKNRLLPFFLFFALSCGAQTPTAVSGTIRNPAGAAFGNGRFLVQMTKGGVLNTCVSPSVVVPTVSTIIQIANGALASTNLIPSDCLNQFVPYRVTLQDSTQHVIVTEFWYVAQSVGALISPVTGSKYIYPGGLAAGTQNSVVFVVPQTIAGMKFATLSASATGTFVVTWPQAFTDASYVTVCSFVNTTNSTPFLYVSAISGQTTKQIKVTLSITGAGSNSGKISCFGREPS